MSGLEVAVAVSTIISGFATAIDSFTNYRERRRERKAKEAESQSSSAIIRYEEEHQKVGNSLQLGRQDVRREYDAGVAAHGEAFQRGDELGIAQLKDMVIKLQDNTIKVLTGLLALPTGGSPEESIRQSLADVFKASEETRTGTVNALHDQFQRLSVRKPIEPGLSTGGIECPIYKMIQECPQGDRCPYIHRKRPLKLPAGTNPVTPNMGNSTSSTTTQIHNSSLSKYGPVPPEKVYPPSEYQEGEYCPFAKELQQLEEKGKFVQVPRRWINSDGHETRQRRCPASKCTFTMTDKPLDNHPYEWAKIFFSQHVYSTSGTSADTMFRCKACVDTVHKLRLDALSFKMATWNSATSPRPPRLEDIKLDMPTSYRDVKSFREHLVSHVGSAAWKLRQESGVSKYLGWTGLSN